MEELQLQLQTNIWDRPSRSTSIDNVSRSYPKDRELPALTPKDVEHDHDDDDDDGVDEQSSATPNVKIDAAIAEELETHFSNGLNNVSTTKNKREVLEISKRTGVSASHIKRWIHNRKRKGKPRSSGSVTQCPRAYDAYLSTAFKGLSGEEKEKAMKQAPVEWKRLSKDKVVVAKYKKLAEQQAKEKMENLSDKQRANIAKKLMDKANKIIKDFEELGYACAIIASDGERVLEGYSSKIQATTQKQMGNLMLNEIFSGTRDEKQECLDRDSLRTKVTNMLNKKYVEGIPGCKRRTVPYTKMDTFSVEGLPHGVELKRTCLYDKKTLVSLMNNMSSIKFSAKQVVEEATKENEMDVVQGQATQEATNEASPLSPEAIPLEDIDESDSDHAPLADFKSIKQPNKPDNLPCNTNPPVIPVITHSVTPAAIPVKSSNVRQGNDALKQKKKSKRTKMKRKGNVIMRLKVKYFQLNSMESALLVCLNRKIKLSIK
ncbi:uncharacterized protein LOC121428662 [Lytechinus variegatus]|uniref:uncharacterized protein LOC121428662 n=1 Tax=Lytechinus variegatus TaxID=7654 RepID=UPI001BB292FB|nr:uncharacterized protein LOC121428662 [Lytechinus variegatus]